MSDQWKRSLREIHFPEVTARESLEEIGQAIITREQGFYNASPALSPLGDKLAIGRRIELRRDRAESSGSSLTAPVLERSSTEQINLPESSEEEGAPIMRERRRER